jgi:predicted nucleic-acid-binding protein
VKGIDTNVLVRYLAQDDPEQAAKATRFIANECSVDEPCLVNRVVLCELVWVLETAYGYPRARIASLLDQLFLTAELRIENSREASAALSEYWDGADFADALIAFDNLHLGCEYTVTFDRKASRRDGFVLLK